jgi:predicted acetyltransferase
VDTGAESGPQAASPAAPRPPSERHERALRLRPLREDDEAAFVAAHAATTDDRFNFGGAYEPGMPWAAYLTTLEDHRHGRNLKPGFVPGTFLVADVAGQIVGRTSIRFALNDFLLREGGHIGYGVVPGHRRRGYATEILRQSLVIARAAGVGRVLVVCDEDNTGSRAVIESCGGRLDSVVRIADGRPPKRRYWID